jgi:hypothetical protein
MRWFGESWGAPVNHPDYEIPIPLTEPCQFCGIPFATDDHGVQIPHLGGQEEVTNYHRLCFNKLILGWDMAGVIERNHGAEAEREQGQPGEQADDQRRAESSPL